MKNINSIAEADYSNDKLDGNYKISAIWYLNIKDHSHLDRELELYKNFKITPKTVNPKELLTEKINEFTKLASLARENDFKYIDWLISNGCKYGFEVISRPIFNEEYNMAIIKIERVCAPLYGSGLIAIYKLHNEVWTEEVILYIWLY